MRKTGIWAVLAGTMAMVACDGTTEPDDEIILPTEQLTFARLAAGVTVPTRDTSFVVTAGEEFILELRTDPEPGDEDGEEFFQFELDQASLLRRPDGTLFQPGDTITIHVSIPGNDFIVYFEPSGLRFDPGEPAELQWSYGDADDDLDDDGDIDDDDLEFEGDLAIWRQEQPGDPWLRMGGIHEIELDEIEIDITGFTGFALAGS